MLAPLDPHTQKMPLETLKKESPSVRIFSRLEEQKKDENHGEEKRENKRSKKGNDTP